MDLVSGQRYWVAAHILPCLASSQLAAKASRTKDPIDLMWNNILIAHQTVHERPVKFSQSFATAVPIWRDAVATRGVLRELSGDCPRHADGQEGLELSEPDPHQPTSHHHATRGVDEEHDHPQMGLY